MDLRLALRLKPRRFTLVPAFAQLEIYKNPARRHFRPETLELWRALRQHPPMPRLALLQSRSFATKPEAFAHHAQLIRQAAAAGANIVVTQELFLTPYFCEVQDPAAFDLADPLPGPLTAQLGALAGELGIVLIASLFERRGPGIYHNTAAIFDADGSLLGLYRKAHIPPGPRV